MPKVLQSIHVLIDEHGRVQLPRHLQVQGRQLAILTLLDQVPVLDEHSYIDPNGAGDEALMSQPVLAEGWDTPEEDEAWAYLQDVDGGAPQD